MMNAGSYICIYMEMDAQYNVKWNIILYCIVILLVRICYVLVRSMRSLSCLYLILLGFWNRRRLLDGMSSCACRTQSVDWCSYTDGARIRAPYSRHRKHMSERASERACGGNNNNTRKHVVVAECRRANTNTACALTGEHCVRQTQHFKREPPANQMNESESERASLSLELYTLACPFIHAPFAHQLCMCIRGVQSYEIKRWSIHVRSFVRFVVSFVRFLELDARIAKHTRAANPGTHGDCVFSLNNFDFVYWCIARQKKKLFSVFRHHSDMVARQIKLL